MSNNLNIPNVISGVRVLLGLWIIKLAGDGAWRRAFACLAVGQLTDPLDGYLARRTGIASAENQFGARLDLAGDGTLTMGSAFGLVRSGDVSLQAYGGFAVVAATANFYVGPRMKLPLVLSGSILYYLVASGVYGRKAGLTYVQIGAYAVLFLLYFRLGDWQRLEREFAKFT